jgi:uncharacterized protein (TIGR00255 family)
MTGYGKASAEINGKKITVEIKSLNSKQCDISTRIPSSYREKDIEVRNEIIQQLERGKIDFSLQVENNSSADCSGKINQNIVENYYWQIKEMSERLHIQVPADWFQTLLRLPDVLKTESQELDENEWAEIKKVIALAIEQFNAFRAQEGKSLQTVFEKKIARIGELAQEINKYEAERIEKIKTRLRDNLAAIGEVDYDKNRFEQELIFYIEKLDVNEEKVRLKNHLNYFTETMQHEKSPGKKLGFIAQEIGREVNTLGSKSNHSEMQKLVVLMKDELEQIKEQVLNVL